MKEFYEFAPFRLDAKKSRLLCGDEIVHLTPKEFEVLFLLVQNAGRVVEKDELLDAVWKDTFVEEGTLTRNISWLRKKLAARSDAKIIETLPKRGYRFLPEIKSADENLTGFERYFEEQTIQRIEIEEIIEFEPSDVEREKVGEKPSQTVKELPSAPRKNHLSPLWIVPLLLTFALFSLFAYRGFVSGDEVKINLAVKVTPFSGSPGRENSPAFSPDGRQIVFAWDGGVEGANSDIYIKLVGTGEPVRLTETEWEEINPTFSPDGKSIAFLRVLPDHNEIILIPALGGAERKLYENAGYASLSFSSDGKHLAFAELAPADNQAGIYTLDLATGEKTKLTAPENPAVDHTPRFSPDGKLLAFIRYFNSFKREIFVVSAAGGEPRQITDDDVRIYGLTWNTDSRSLFFSSFRSSNQMNLWKISADENAAPQMISTGSKNLADLTISPDGKTIAYVEETADENIWEYDGQTKRPLIRSIRADHSQQFSPDGSRIVFASDRTGNFEVWIADADGKNQRQLTDTKESAGSPRFSPDGKFIVYDEQTSGSSDLYIISVNGGLPRRLTENVKSNSLPAWSADGNSIFFLSNRSGTEQIWKMPAGGGKPAQITKQSAFEMFAAADGKTIIYSKGGGKAGLWRVKTDGSGEEPIPELGEVGGWRSWTVAPNGIYYTSFAVQPPFHIKFFDFAARQTKVITTVEKSPLLYYSNLSVSPDGRKILYARQDQSASSIMLANLSE